MKFEVHEYIDQSGFSRGAVEHIAGMLPEDDLELDEWIAESVRDFDTKAFMVIVFAALSRGRPVDAGHLVGGAKLIGGPTYLAAMVMRMQGEVAEYLLEGLRNTAMYHWNEATALLCVAAWCDEHRGGVYPDQFLPLAHSLAKRVKGVAEVDAVLLELALRTKDEALQSLVRQHYPKGPDHLWQKVLEGSRHVASQTMAGSLGTVLDHLPEIPIFPVDPTATVRRAVPRLGRNEPCHCGSGKKYKNCHYEADRERLQQSSGVAGATLQEVSEQPERHLTLERLQKTSAANLGRMNPAEIPRFLLTEYFVRLSLVALDRAAEFLEKLGYAEDLEDSWFFIMFTAVRAGRKDIGVRMLKLREPEGLTEDQLRLSQRLLLAQDDPAKCINLIEEAALNVLKTEKQEDLTDLPFAVAHSQFTALGVLLYRSVLPLIPRKEAESSYDLMKTIRERLKLSPEDPIRAALAAHVSDADAALREAEEKFEAKRNEARALKESLDQVQKELARQERAISRDSAASAAGAGEAEERLLRGLRQQLKNLEIDLKEKHSETNALQRQLDEMQIRAEAERDRAPFAAEPDHEDDLLLPQDDEESQPLRLIEFPKNFHARLNEFPHHVSRAAMIMLGRLAGGDSAAFSGAKRLKSRPNFMRQRIGIDFRLLFRLLPDRIQVVDLIPRQDLERRIKTL